MSGSHCICDSVRVAECDRVQHGVKYPRGRGVKGRNTATGTTTVTDRNMRALAFFLRRALGTLYSTFESLSRVVNCDLVYMSGSHCICNSVIVAECDRVHYGVKYPRGWDVKGINTPTGTTTVTDRNMRALAFFLRRALGTLYSTFESTLQAVNCGLVYMSGSHCICNSVIVAECDRSFLPKTDCTSTARQGVMSRSCSGSCWPWRAVELQYATSADRQSCLNNAFCILLTIQQSLWLMVIMIVSVPLSSFHSLQTLTIPVSQKLYLWCY
ncbi:hypothetical protein J6590_096535 [Homalodisca vitripennis]|nr:hypothetical protein J6590_096535 [Homalodisca vitripennis]